MAQSRRERCARSLMSGSMRWGNSATSAESPATATRTRSEERLFTAGGARVQGGQQLLVDVVEAAVGHDHDEIAVAALAGDGRDDVVDLRDVAGVDVGGLQVGDQLLGRQPLVLRQARAEHRRKHHGVGRGQRAGEVRLEDAAARRRRSRLEDRPDPSVRKRGPHARQRLRDRGRVVGEVVVDRHARGRAAQLHPAAHAFEPPQPVRHRVGVQSDGRADRERGQRVPDVEGAEQRQLELPDRRAAAPHAERRRRARDPQIVRLPVGAVAQPERLDPALRRARGAPAPRRCRRRAAAGRGAESGSRSAGTPAGSPRGRHRCPRDRTRCC